MIRSRRQTAHTPIIFVTAFTDEMHTAQGYSLGAVDYILAPVVPEILRTKVGVFVDLYRKTQQVRRQAEERVALAEERAARAAAEEANRRLAFLAEASTVLAARSITRRPPGAGPPRRPLPGRPGAVTLPARARPGRRRTELAWIDPDGPRPPVSDLRPPTAPPTPSVPAVVRAPRTAASRTVQDRGLDIPDPAKPADPAARSRPAPARSAVSPLPGPRPDPRRACRWPARPCGRSFSPPTTWPCEDLAGRAPPSPSTTPGSTATSRRTTGARTSSWRCWPTSCATPWPRSATPSTILQARGRTTADLQLGPRRDRPPGRAAGPAGRRPARHLADHPRQDPAPQGAGRRRRRRRPAPSRPAGR